MILLSFARTFLNFARVKGFFVGYAKLVTAFGLSVFVMLGLLWLGLEARGMSLVMASIAGIMFFSGAGFFTDSFHTYFYASAAVQLCYFTLDYGASLVTGKSYAFAAVQLVNYLVAGTLFAIVAVGMYSAVEEDELAAYGSFYHKNQFLVAFLAIACLSLGGLPGFNIFVGEFMMYSLLLAIHPALAIAAIFASLVCFLFYFRMVYIAFAGKEMPAVKMPWIARCASAFLAAGVIVLGVIPQILHAFAGVLP